MPEHRSVKLYTDGGSRGNPGRSAIGVLIVGSGCSILTEHAEVIKDGTNNEAEYKAMTIGLGLCLQHTTEYVTCYSDSEVLIRQMNGDYKVRAENLKRLRRKLLHTVVQFKEVEFKHVPRNNPHIAIADGLLNEAMDTA